MTWFRTPASIRRELQAEELFRKADTILGEIQRVLPLLTMQLVSRSGAPQISPLEALIGGAGKALAEAQQQKLHAQQDNNGAMRR